MTSRFNYVLRKISSAEVTSVPFDHIYIGNLFSESDFEEIVTAQEIDMRTQANDESLFAALFENGYRIINFPGCITDKDAYVKWHNQRDRFPVLNNEACEGFGVTLRLMETKSSVLSELREFINSSELQVCLADKYQLLLSDVTYDCGIQKYLDGYEISPHPDIRRKALTYMVNINPGKNSEQRKHHTQYLRFKKSRAYVQTFWDGNPDQDRCWVPWDWCETFNEQVANNSMVIFAPGNDTMHGVKAAYDHLVSQRTQLYGNLWFKEVDCKGGPDWKQLSFRGSTSGANALPQPGSPVIETLKSFLPTWVKRIIKSALGKSSEKNVIGDRLNSK
jgi:hypothetical protein